MKCPRNRCNHELSGDWVCPVHGPITRPEWMGMRATPGMVDVSEVIDTPVSVVDDSLDQMVQAASVPNLASLFKQAKARGVIVPGKEYGDKT